MRAALWRRLARIEDRQLEMARRALFATQREATRLEASHAALRHRWSRALAPPIDAAGLAVAWAWARRLYTQLEELDRQRQQLAAEEAQARERVRLQLARRNAFARLAELAAAQARADEEQRAQYMLDDLAVWRRLQVDFALPAAPSDGSPTVLFDPRRNGDWPGQGRRPTSAFAAEGRFGRRTRA